MEKPSLENAYLAAHANLLISSYHRITGNELVVAEVAGPEKLYHANFCVVSHNTHEDPLFNYGNRKALELFDMEWSNFISLPSRYSAEPVNREERVRLLNRVESHGFIDDYCGVRISANGTRFVIKSATVWNVVDEMGIYRGQAAMFRDWTFV